MKIDFLAYAIMAFGTATDTVVEVGIYLNESEAERQAQEMESKMAHLGIRYRVVQVNCRNYD